MVEEKQGDSGVFLIAVGGTIAAEPYECTPNNVTVKSNAHVIKAARGMAGGAFTAHDYAIVDSKELTLEDTRALAGMIAARPEHGVVITQGTDAMAPNARAMLAHLKQYCPALLEEKCILFTGAMEPLKHGRASDGFANLAFALEQCRNPERKGVWIAFDGALKDPQVTDKDFERKQFVERLAEKDRSPWIGK